MGIDETKLQRVYFENTNYSSPMNTVYVASSPIQNNVWDKSTLNLPPLTDSFEKTPAEKPKSKPKAKPKPVNRNAISRTINFMGKPVKMTGKIVRGKDGSYSHYLADENGNICIIDYDKKGNILKMQQESTSKDKYKCLSSEIDPKTNITRNVSILKDLKTGTQSEYSDHTDKDGRKLDEQTLEKEAGKETATFRQFDENGDETSVTETVTKGNISTISSAEIDSESGVIKSEESVYNSETNEGSSSISEYTETETGEQIVKRESKSTLKDGIRTSEETRYDNEGNPISETTSKHYPDGSVNSQSTRINADNTVTESTETHNNKTGYINKYTSKKDNNGNVLSENIFLKENGITTQEHQTYNSEGQVTSHRISQAGKGIYTSEDSFFNENGQPDGSKTMILDGKKYTDETEFQKAVDERLKK